jgi:CRISPR/Cas system-associated exonuclease Cas4 (RecB family)
MNEQIHAYLFKLLKDIAATDTEIVLFAIILVATVIVLDAVSAFAKKQRGATGIEDHKAGTRMERIDSRPVKDYVSDMQGLAGKPDALISENGWIIPVERKPLARKIRDRYVAQLLVYMRLVEEFEGKKPPYGYLILGANCRRVKIANSPGRQAWLQGYIDQMRRVLEQNEQPRPAPFPQKCREMPRPRALPIRRRRAAGLQALPGSETSRTGVTVTDFPSWAASSDPRRSRGKS